MTQLSLTQIKRRYVLEARPLDAAMEAALRADSRAGARAVLQAIERRRFENRAEGQRLRRLMRYEWSLWDKGILQVADLTVLVRLSYLSPEIVRAILMGQQPVELSATRLMHLSKDLPQEWHAQRRVVGLAA